MISLRESRRWGSVRVEVCILNIWRFAQSGRFGEMEEIGVGYGSRLGYGYGQKCFPLLPFCLARSHGQIIMDAHSSGDISTQREFCAQGNVSQIWLVGTRVIARTCVARRLSFTICQFSVGGILALYFNSTLCLVRSPFPTKPPPRQTGLINPNNNKKKKATPTQKGHTTFMHLDTSNKPRCKGPSQRTLDCS